VSAIDSDCRTIWIVDAHRDDGKRFVVRADEKLSAFVELGSAIRVSDEALHKNRLTNLRGFLKTLAGKRSESGVGKSRPSLGAFFPSFRPPVAGSTTERRRK
jgi:hypothetical protein